MAASSQRWSSRHWPPQGMGAHFSPGAARAKCSGQGRGGMPMDELVLAAADSVLRRARSSVEVRFGSATGMGAQAPITAANAARQANRSTVLAVYYFPAWVGEPGASSAATASALMPTSIASGAPGSACSIRAESAFFCASVRAAFPPESSRTAARYASR